ncbi:hypothetical protein L6R52_26740 [Myxococcota bacterium]|nr:hypothetical protein [Myxococcota bacterium]
MESVATDLHGHTLFSDGRTTPGAFVRTRARAGLELVAISDHDHFAASRAGLAATEGTGMTFLPAAECTSFLHFGTDEAEQLHVLAYFPPSHFDGDRLERTRLYQRGLRVQVCWKAFVLDWLATLDEPARLAIGGRRALATIPAPEFPALQSMIDHILATRPDLSDGFRRHHVRFWHEHAELFAWRPEELIDEIRGDGGVDVVAHAIRYKDKARLDQVLDYATAIEVYTSRHNEKVAARFLAIAEAKNKLWTASTDDHQHGPYARPPFGTPRATIARLLGG